MANVKPTKGGFVVCECKNLSSKDPPTGSSCICSVTSDISKEPKRRFKTKKLSGITNVVVRKK